MMVTVIEHVSQYLLYLCFTAVWLHLLSVAKIRGVWIKAVRDPAVPSVCRLNDLTVFLSPSFTLKEIKGGNSPSQFSSINFISHNLLLAENVYFFLPQIVCYANQRK